LSVLNIHGLYIQVGYDKKNVKLLKQKWCFWSILSPITRFT